MSEIKVLLFDVGGVLLTNAWDRHSRSRVCERFNVDLAEFEERHAFVATDFEIGKLSLDEYLERTVFYRPRTFSKEEFFQFMKDQSQPLEPSLTLATAIAASGRYLMGTLNNESRELNDYRIATFGLTDLFDVFFSSCYLGVRKPAEDIYRMALDVTQHRPEECLFIDDRPLNLECATLLGLRTIHFEGAEDLRAKLAELGVGV